MTEIFEYKSDKFTTQTVMKKEIAQLKSDMCNHFGYDRSEIRLPNGLIILYGYSKITNTYLPISKVIGDFNSELKNEIYTDYYVYTRLGQSI